MLLPRSLGVCPLRHAAERLCQHALFDVPHKQPHQRHQRRRAQQAQQDDPDRFHIRFSGAAHRSSTIFCASSNPALAGTHGSEPARSGGPAAGAERLGRHGGLGAEHDRVVRDAGAAQLAAHDARERAAARLADVAELEPARVQLVAGAERRHDGNAARVRGADQIHLTGHEINAIGDVIILRVEKPLPRRRLVALGARINGDGGVNVVHTRGHDGRLRLADRRVQRAALAVKVALADGVLVHERERTDAGAGQRLGTPAAHAAETEHRHTAAPQARERALAEEHLRADGLLGHSAPSRSKVTTKSVPS